MEPNYSVFIKKIIKSYYDKEDDKEKYLKELLKFITSSAKVPAGGYKGEIMGTDGPPTFILREHGLTILAHTCFNYVDIKKDALEELILLENNQEELEKQYLYKCFSLEKLIENSSTFSMAGGSKDKDLSFGYTKKYKIIKIKNYKNIKY